MKSVVFMKKALSPFDLALLKPSSNTTNTAYFKEQTGCSY